MKNDDDDKKVEVFHRVNRLKNKAGGTDGVRGKFDPEMIEQANQVVADAAENYPEELERVMKELTGLWSEIKNAKMKDEEKTEQLYHLANQVKDLAALFNFKLMADFASSLRKFADVFDVTNKAHVTIIQAHMDVMWVVYRENVKDGGGVIAQELKKTLAKAIAEHSKAEE